MKILLLGEFSGLMTNVGAGLRKLGHEVFTASNGDTFKDYPADYRWDSKRKGKIGVYETYFNFYSHKKKFTGFDVVFVVTPRIGPRVFWSPKDASYRFFEFLKDHNNKVFLSGAGLSYVGYDYWYNQKDSKYFHYVNGYMKQSLKMTGKPYYMYGPDREEKMNEEFHIMSIIDGYIPIMYEYVPYYENHPAYRECIPIPIKAEDYEYKPNIVKDKIVFFHGITRASKGGEYIYAAFEQLEKKYSSVAEFNCKGGLPFDEYVQVLAKTNVVLDDTNAYSLGLNSLYSMVQGRVVMGGSEPVANELIGYDNNPAINLRPDVKYIEEQIEKVIENKKDLEEMGYASHQLVVKYHDWIRVAKRYEQVFSR